MTTNATRRTAVLIALLAGGLALGGRVLAGDDPKPPPSGEEKDKEGEKGKEKEGEKEKPAEEAKTKRAEAPAFKLKDSNDKEHSLADFKDKIVVLEWINHKCPYVVKHYETGNMQELQKKYTGKGVIWLSICSSAEGKEGYLTPKEWNEKCEKVKAAATAVLLDSEGTTGKAYGAKNTPYMVVVDAKGRIAYKGAIDDNPSKKAEDAKTAKNHVAEAVDALLEGKEPPVADTKPYG